MSSIKLQYHEEIERKRLARITKHEKKYGNDWFFTDMTYQIEEELLDAMNYLEFLYGKVQHLRELLRKYDGK